MDEREPPEFAVVVAPAPEGSIVSATGELDLATAAPLEAAVRSLLRRGPVVLDLRELAFMDSTGVRTLDALARDADREGRRFAIRPELRPPVRQVLVLTGMIDTLPLVGNGAA